MSLGQHNELLEMNLTRSQSRKKVYEVRVYFHEPVWFKNNKTSLFLMHNPAVFMNIMHTRSQSGFNPNLNRNGKH